MLHALPSRPADTEHDVEARQIALLRAADLREALRPVADALEALGVGYFIG